MGDVNCFSIITGLQGGASSGFGPMPAVRTSTGPTLMRFHPYGAGSQRIMYGANVGTQCSARSNSSCSTEPGNYLSGSRHFLGTDDILASRLYYQDVLSHNAKHQDKSCQPTSKTNLLHNLCGPVASAETSFPSLSPPVTVRKDQNHPFYWRKRVEPVEGMTRTRDKYRVVYTEKQRKGLEKEYNTNKFITTERKAEISKELSLSARQIKIWFQNRRAKERRDSRKCKDRQQTENSIEDENNIDECSPSSLANADFSTSCRFTGSNSRPEERLYSSGQCQFLNYSQSANISKNISASPNACFFESRDSEAFRHSVSPSEWSTSAYSNFIPSLDVSPLTGNTNFDFGLRF